MKTHEEKHIAFYYQSKSGSTYDGLTHLTTWHDFWMALVEIEKSKRFYERFKEAQNKKAGLV